MPLVTLTANKYYFQSTLISHYYSTIQILYLGEYSNPQMEELFEWINATVPVEASFAGMSVYQMCFVCSSINMADTLIMDTLLL